MSRYLKQLITEEFKRRWDGVSQAVAVNLTGLDAVTNNQLRLELADKGIEVMIIRNSLARRAAEGTPLAAMFDDLSGQVAVCWGGEDVVDLAKKLVALDKDATKYEPFKILGGVLDGQKLSGEEVKGVSKWPSRAEQLSLVSGQILAPGANLGGALLGPFRMLASQIKQIEEKAEEGGAAEGEG